MLPIVQAPHHVLSDIAKPIEKVDESVLKIIEQMKETLAATRDPEGVGLAAPQIGKSVRIFIAKPTPKASVLVCVNPVVTLKGEKLVPLKRPKKSSNKRAGTLEGCLSLKDIWGPVLRAPEVELQYMDEHGKTHKKHLKGFMATIAQHEVDHLDGILFPRRVLEQNGKLYKSFKNEKGEDEFEPLEI